MASDALPLPEQTPQSNESFAKDIAEKMMSDKARTRAEKKKRHREKYKLAKRTKPGSSEGEGIQLAVRRAANLRRRRLQKALDTKDKMGLTKLGSEQLMRFCSKKASTDVIPAMGELEPSAQKVLAPILAQEYDELMAWPAEREPGQVPKDKKEESGNETKLGAKEEKMGGQDEIEMEDLKEEWEQEWGPEPVRSLWANSFRLSSSCLPSRNIYTHFRTISTSPDSPSLDTSTIARDGALYQQEPPPFTTPAFEKRPQTLTEKIVQRYAVSLPEGKLVRSGDYISLSPAYCMTHDNSWPVALKFMAIGATQVRNPRQIVFTLDHDIQNTSDANLKKYQQIEAFAEKHSIDHFPPGRGIGHQIMVEEGYAWPGTMCVASDSHSNHYGGVGCLGSPLVRTDAASIWATSRTWWQIPPVARVNFAGTLPPGVTAKDIAVALNIFFKSDVLNHAVEFTGSEETMASLPVDSRLTIANMTTEMAALSGLFPVDKTLERWLRNKATEAAILDDRTTRLRITHEKVDELFANPLTADRDAVYAKQLYLNLDTLAPYVSGPDSVKVGTPLHELAPQHIKINRAYIVSCTNSRASDLAAAAKVFKDTAKANPDTPPKIAEGVQLYIAAASAPEQEAAEAVGDWQALLDAGAQALPAGCGPCIGLGTGLLEPGEVGIRVGHRDAQTYLASPEVVAASALKGVISGPDSYEVPMNWSGVEYGYGTGAEPATENKLSNFLQQMESLIERVESIETPRSEVDILPGFPEKISGEIIFCDADNLNTDGIYPGKYTYQDNLSKEDMARVCMENYDPQFDSIARPNDILVSGFNFGCGSSREQAATAILAKQIPLVVAGSLGNIFSRNSFNNALMGLEVPRLVQRLRTHFTSLSNDTKRQLTRRTGWTLTWDVKRSLIEVQEGEGGETWTEQVGELSRNVQEIIAAGGLEAWVKAEIGKAAAANT